jgi:outer membrane lipoprotein-sorting protein
MINLIRNVSLLVFFSSASLWVAAQDINTLVLKAKQKIDKVNDYEASGKMKTNVTFLKVPIATVKIYFKKPNKLKVKSEKGAFMKSVKRTSGPFGEILFLTQKIQNPLCRQIYK